MRAGTVRPPVHRHGGALCALLLLVAELALLGFAQDYPGDLGQVRLLQQLSLQLIPKQNDIDTTFILKPLFVARMKINLKLIPEILVYGVDWDIHFYQV